jgi:hypothetical protein
MTLIIVFVVVYEEQSGLIISCVKPFSQIMQIFRSVLRNSSHRSQSCVSVIRDAHRDFPEIGLGLARICLFPVKTAMRNKGKFSETEFCSIFITLYTGRSTRVRDGDLENGKGCNCSFDEGCKLVICHVVSD